MSEEKGERESDSYGKERMGDGLLVKERKKKGGLLLPVQKKEK